MSNFVEVYGSSTARYPSETETGAPGSFRHNPDSFSPYNSGVIYVVSYFTHFCMEWPHFFFEIFF